MPLMVHGTADVRMFDLAVVTAMRGEVVQGRHPPPTRAFCGVPGCRWAPVVRFCPSAIGTTHRAASNRVGLPRPQSVDGRGLAGGATIIPPTTVPDGTDPAEVDRIRAGRPYAPGNWRPQDISCVWGAR